MVRATGVQQSLSRCSSSPRGAVVGSLAIAWLAVSAGAGDETLAGYRASIDNIDASLVMLLGERFKITKQVGIYKARVGLPAADPEREAEQIVRLREVAASVDLDPAFSEKFLRLVFAEVRREHELARRDAADS